MKIGAAVALLILVLWALLAILQLWFTPLSAEVFVKVTITAAIVEGVVLLVTLAVREYLSEKQMKKDGFLD